MVPTGLEHLSWHTKFSQASPHYMSACHKASLTHADLLSIYGTTLVSGRTHNQSTLAHTVKHLLRVADC